MGFPPTTRGSRRRGSRLLPLAPLLVFLSSSLAARDAFALQPLEAFLESARRTNPDMREAGAIERQRDAERDVSTAKLLPSLTAQGTYTRNAKEAAFSAPGGGPKITLQALNALDGSLSLTVPLFDLAAIQRRRAATATLAASRASVLGTEASVEQSVAEAYYQLVGQEALVGKTQTALAYTEQNQRLVADRKELGSASELDLQRSVADVARARQELVGAEQGVADARRSLETLAGLTPQPGDERALLEDDLRGELPIGSWLGESDGRDLVSAQLAAANSLVAARNVSVARAAWAPTLAVQGQARATNAGGFAGQNVLFVLSATATWKLDAAIAPNVAAFEAAQIAAQAREQKARRTAADAVHRAWTRVQAGIEKARGARAQLDAATAAVELSRVRYAGGVATQIEVVEAQRDFSDASVAQIQAVADLKYARALLRIVSRRAHEGRVIR